MFQYKGPSDLVIMYNKTFGDYSWTGSNGEGFSIRRSMKKVNSIKIEGPDAKECK